MSFHFRFHMFLILEQALAAVSVFCIPLTLYVPIEHEASCSQEAEHDFVFELYLAPTILLYASVPYSTSYLCLIYCTSTYQRYRTKEFRLSVP